MKILIVDDSVVFRMAIKQVLSQIEGVKLCESLSNGKLAIDYIQKNDDVDLITLDMEMPVMDGMETIKEIRKINKRVPIIVFSSLTTRGAEKTIDALTLGANDFVTKLESSKAKSIEDSLDMIKEKLMPKVIAFKKPAVKEVSTIDSNVSSTNNKSVDIIIKPKLIVMTSSTGGPEALTKVFRGIEKGNNVPILLVQHMPPIFTQKLASMLDKICPGYKVKEAEEDEMIESNTCYIAPGDYHMRLNRNGLIKLDQQEKVCFVRPSANCLFESVALNYTSQVAAFVLTGMGEDGAEGLKALSRNGCYSFYQDEASSTVWGMPGAAKRTETASEVKIMEIANLINNINKRV